MKIIKSKIKEDYEVILFNIDRQEDLILSIPFGLYDEICVRDDIKVKYEYSLKLMEEQYGDI